MFCCVPVSNAALAAIVDIVVRVARVALSGHVARDIVGPLGVLVAHDVTAALVALGTLAAQVVRAARAALVALV
eukprot:15439597-Alexandrium_andersonii.AAC.1